MADDSFLPSNDCWYNRWRTASSIIFENLQVCDIVRSEISIFLLLLSNHDAVAFPFTGRGWTNLEIGIFPAVLDLAIGMCRQAWCIHEIS